MVQRLPHGYVFDPDDPRAPTDEQWAQMTPDERRRVVAMLPAEVPWELSPPEGDPHREAKEKSRAVLDDFFRRAGRRVYVSSELGVFYPGEPRFAPDVLAVLDVDPRQRTRWVVSDEGKGLDLVIEVYFEGDAKKDFEVNVERYARLGIAEYFVFDRGRPGLRGWRLPDAKARVFRPIVPQEGRYTSRVLGLDLAVEGERLRFYAGSEPLPDAEELIAKLDGILDEREKKIRELQRRLDEERAGRAAVEARLAEALAEIERLKRGG